MTRSAIFRLAGEGGDSVPRKVPCDSEGNLTDLDRVRVIAGQLAAQRRCTVEALDPDFGYVLCEAPWPPIAEERGRP